MMDNLLEKKSTLKNDPSSWLELQRYINWIAASILPVSAAYIYSAVISGSRSVAAMMYFCVISVFFNVFAVISVRAIVRQNIFVFPYGAGKLENFIAFLSGTLMLPAAVMIYVSTIGSFISGEHAVRFELTQIGMIPALLRDLWLMTWSKRLMRRSPSPIVRSYYVGYKVSVTIALTGVFSMLLALWLAKRQQGALGAMIDLGLAFILATYMAVSAVILVKANFRALIDLPLPESDQVRILNVLTRHHDAFDGLGAVCTRTSGSAKIIEIELHFEGTTPLEKIHALAESFRTDLAAEFHNFDFRLVPVVDRRLPPAGKPREG